MSIESSQNWPAAEPPPFVPAPRRRWPFALFVAVVLALVGAGAAYAWMNPGLFGQLTGREAGDADGKANDSAVMTDLLAAQQKTAEDLATIDRTIADQQEQLKAIMSQLADLNAKIDALKSPAPQPSVAPAPLTAPTAAMPPAPPAAPAPAARAVPKQKKPPHVTAPSGPISVGGAPLNVTPDTTVR
ncbi:hypothetical protein [Bradyrhizobium sp. BR 10289]|uniref:hypothetical protein n=1 Tax=Bradyrhizobium sp. BR 10289 TaxID=2749993 RepID=UPI001C652C8C|nr:hypothetical protein [Bradyrhizobium sp. BR 10289]MBW7971674.1 hypothetical protein [Bradyrhizobium sp. BR 10289]